jgi:hypothetical protein
MNRVAFHSVLREAAGLAGFTLAQLTATPKTQLKTFISRRGREYWDHWWWNQIMHAELRYYRDAYDAATAYAEDDEIYYSTTGLYYICILASTGNAPTNTTYWEEVTELDAYIELAQTGQEEIGTVRLLSPDNPLEEREPRVQPFRLIGEKIQVLGVDVPASVYVWFREPAPTWLGDDFDATATYAVGEVMYYEGAGVDYEGDFWTCLTATTAGQDPEDATAKWERIGFPKWLREPVAQAAYADWLRQDGNPEAARLEDSEAQRLLIRAIHRDGPAQRQLLRAAGA